MVFRQTARRTVRSGVLWGYVFGLYVATQALAYASSYKTVAQRIGLAKEFGANAGVSALVGPAHDIQTVAGFTVWKCLAVLAVVGAVWGLLTARGCCAARRIAGAGAPAGRSDHAQGRRRPGPRRPGLRCRCVVTISAAILVVVAVRQRSMSAPRSVVSGCCHRGGCRDVPGCRDSCEPVCRDAPPGIRLRRLPSSA